MPIIPKVGRQSVPVVTFIVVSYLLLTLGGLTMVVPFLIMLSSSVANEWDYERFSPVPRYVFDRPERYLKFLAEKYLNVQRVFPRDFRLFAAAYEPKPHWVSFRAIREDPDAANLRPFLFGQEEARADQLRQMRRDYLEWIDACDPLWTLPMFARLTRPAYQTFMRSKYEGAYLDAQGVERGDLSKSDLEAGALAAMADAWQEAKFTRFFYLEMGSEAAYPYHLREWLPPLDERRFQDYLEFVRSLPGDRRIPITARHLWLRFLDNAAGDLDEFVNATGLRVDSYSKVPFPEHEPENPALRELWGTFVRKKWPLWLMHLPTETAPRYRAFLRERTGDIARFNRLVKAQYRSFDDVPYTGRTPVAALERNFWRDFLNQLPTETLSCHRAYPERAYRAYLKERYGTLEAVNRAYGWSFGRFDEIAVPIAEVDYGHFLAKEKWLVREFLVHNFRQVFRYMAVQNRAALNTLILVALSILACLTVNPLAAYALSRFNMPSSQKLLLFLLATMAFPAEVSMIPNFLLLRELGLLNTFGALVLPRLASGFGIFLLKGFFDSLPRELYEAATIDGATEMVMFRRITLPLSKPILAYQALLTFMATYGGFMWAFLVCQDRSMWTIMVWMYQYQQAASDFPYMVAAAFVIASIPTLLVFVFCQKIILRGIIIPSMK